MLVAVDTYALCCRIPISAIYTRHHRTTSTQAEACRLVELLICQHEILLLIFLNRNSGASISLAIPPGASTFTGSRSDEYRGMRLNSLECRNQNSAPSIPAMGSLSMKVSRSRIYRHIHLRAVDEALNSPRRDFIAMSGCAHQSSAMH